MTALAAVGLVTILATVALSRSVRSPVASAEFDSGHEALASRVLRPVVELTAQRSPSLESAAGDLPPSDCDPFALFERDYAALPEGDAAQPLVSNAVPHDWLDAAWTCALDKDQPSASPQRGTSALLSLAAQRLLMGAGAFRQLCLVEALSRSCSERFELWQELLAADEELLGRLEERTKALILARMPGFHEHAEDPALPWMIHGAIALAQSSDDCCGETRSGFALIVEKFPAAQIQTVAEGLLIGITSREADLNEADPRAIESVCGALRTLAALVEGSRMSIEDALVPTIRAGAEQLAACPRTAIYYFRLLGTGMELGSALALNEALRLGGNPRLDAQRVAFLLSEHASLADVQGWLADGETRDQALRVLIALPLQARPSTEELRSLVKAATGETYFLALKAYLGPIDPSGRDRELFAEYEAATSLESKLGILEIADFYRRPTLEAALLERVSSDTSADPALRARARELTQRFMDSLPVSPGNR